MQSQTRIRIPTILLTTHSIIILILTPLSLQNPLHLSIIIRLHTELVVAVVRLDRFDLYVAPIDRASDGRLRGVGMIPSKTRRRMMPLVLALALLFNTGRDLAERMLAISDNAARAFSFEDLDRADLAGVDLSDSGVLVGGLA